MNCPQPDEHYVIIEIYGEEDDAILFTNSPKYIEKMNRLYKENPYQVIRQPEGKNRAYLFPKEWLSIAKKNSSDYINARTRRCMERLYRQYCELDEQETDENIE